MSTTGGTVAEYPSGGIGSSSNGAGGTPQSGGGSSTGGWPLAAGGQTTTTPASGGQNTGGQNTGGQNTGGQNTGGQNTGGPEAAGGTFGSGGLNAPGGFDPNFHIFLLLGQSNMDGIPQPEAEDLTINERVQVMAFEDCGNLDREEGKWYPAQPPLHRCYGGVGPGDWFGKQMADGLPEATIGLVPCALPSADIDAFRKGVISERRAEYVLPPDDRFPDAYEWVLHRARAASELGVIEGVLLLQGESDNGDQTWVDKVTEIADDLRDDLDIPNAPLLAGELVHGACCDLHNDIIAQVETEVENGHVVSASGLSGLPEETYHFDLQSQRTLGRRFAEKMLQIWSP